MVDPNLLVASGQDLDTNVLSGTWIHRAGDTLAKEGSAELSVLSMGNGHMLCTGKDQVTIGFVILTSCFGLSHCTGQGWCCISVTVC